MRVTSLLVLFGVVAGTVQAAGVFAVDSVAASALQAGMLVLSLSDDPSLDGLDVPVTASAHESDKAAEEAPAFRAAPRSSDAIVACDSLPGVRKLFGDRLTALLLARNH